MCVSLLLTIQSIERSYVSKRGWGKLFLSAEVQNLHKNTVVVDVGPAGSVGCVAQVPSKGRLW